MDRSLQQRLLGAAIVLAVLVMVVPELLDGAGYRNRFPAHIDIPEPPEFKPLPATDPLSIEPPALEEQPVPEALDALVTETTSAPITSLPTTAAPTVKEIVVPNVAEEKKPVNLPEPKIKSVVSKTANSKVSNKNVWALQIGSFSDKKNALKMRDQFRAKNYSTYVDDEKGSYRVRIGPELDRARLERIQKRIAKEDGIKGMIVNK